MIELPRGQEWRRDAPCQFTDPELFFPEKGGPTGNAQRICMGYIDSKGKAVPPCPVRLKCLEFALDNNEQWGVWGGLSRKKRVKLAQKRREAELKRQEEAA